MLKYCGITDIGGRKNNEDAYEIFSLNEKYLVLAVADGLGGHNAGEVASKLSVMKVKETIIQNIGNYDKLTYDEMKELLIKAFKKANDEVCFMGKMPGKYGMGTTLIVAFLDDDGKGWVGNVGDSRGYLIGKNIHRITKDHSYVQELVDRGMITQIEADVHHQKNIVTRIIGEKNVMPDFYYVELGKDMLLLCSDGLTDGLKDEEIKEVCSGTHEICKALVEKAKPISRDNITVALVRGQ